MSLKFAANISMMFKEIEGLENRYKAAWDFGFEAVECAFPYDVPVEKLKAAKERTGLQQVLINAWPGDMKAGDLGIAALPGREAEFQNKLETSIEYANALNCKRMHIMAGKLPKAQEDIFLKNLKYAADRLKRENILAVIEPINDKISAPNYFLTKIPQAVTYIEKLNHGNVKLQMDIFHLQIMSGNLTSMIKQYLPYVGHVQIAQVPDRHEPNSFGEINYQYVFHVLEQCGYDSFIGLEYTPAVETLKGLEWLKDMGLWN